MYNPYIENPTIARAMADNEADWAYTYAKEEQEEADKEEAELAEILKTLDLEEPGKELNLADFL